jgi:hypothetical protein
VENAARGEVVCQRRALRFGCCVGPATISPCNLSGLFSSSPFRSFKKIVQLTLFLMKKLVSLTLESQTKAM